MEQFRPAQAIETDRVLADSFRDGDEAAIRSMVDRFGAPVASVLTAHQARSLAPDVFVQAWVESDEFTSGDDFGPWLRSIASALVPDAPLDAAADDRRWVLASATASFDTDVHDELRRFHVDGDDLADGVDRHELRLQRRLSHLGDRATVDAALADPLVWVRPDDDLAELVVERIAAESESSITATGAGTTSWLTRSIRPVLLGLGGAIVVLFGAIIVLSAASGSVDEPAFTVELTPTGLIADVEPGEVTATETDNGVVFDIDAFTLPRRSGGQFYRAVLVLDGGAEVVAGSFNEGIGVSMTTGVGLEEISEIRIVAAEIGVESDDNDAALKADFPQL